MKLKVRVGAMLTKLMCNNLYYTIGNTKHALLRLKNAKEHNILITDFNNKSNFGSNMICYNRSFIENFVNELDKNHDLNL